jgi:hypothetical protein
LAPSFLSAFIQNLSATFLKNSRKKKVAGEGASPATFYVFFYLQLKDSNFAGGNLPLFEIYIWNGFRNLAGI